MSEVQNSLFQIGKGAKWNGYRILREIGSGGMGRTYEALQLSLDRTVCIKIIHSERAEDRHAIAQFELEARALAKLMHPNIVAVYDFGRYEEVSYIVMELVDGKPLDQFLAGRPIDFHEVLGILGYVGGALSYVHEQKIVHRDIKPSNILMTQHGVPKLADFGVAKIIKNDLQSIDTGGVGTGVFAAPEVLQGKRYDHRADIYSLAVVAFFMLVGKLPEQGDRATDHNPNLPSDVDDILFKALSPRPTDRYELVRTFINDLLNAFIDEGASDIPDRLSSSNNLRVNFRDSKEAVITGGIEFMPTVIDNHPTPPTDPKRKSKSTLEPVDLLATEPTKPVVSPLRVLESTQDTKESIWRESKIGIRKESILEPAETERVADKSTSQKKNLLVPAGVAAAIALALVGGVVGYSLMNKPASQEAVLPQSGAENQQLALVPKAPVTTPVTEPRKTEPLQPKLNLPFPTTPWKFQETVSITPRPYAFLAATASGLWASTFNNTSNPDEMTEVYFIDPKSKTERRVTSLLCNAQQGISGLAVDEPGNVVFVTHDAASSPDSFVYRFNLSGAPSTAFGKEGRVNLNSRVLGCCVFGDRLFVLVPWGKVQELNAVTGSEVQSFDLSAGAYLRDIAFANNTLGAFGAGTFVEYDLNTNKTLSVQKLMENAVPRPTEGIGSNRITGEFIVRPPDTSDLMSLGGGNKLVSKTDSAEVSIHTVDFAVSPDGNSLYVSDLRNKSIDLFKRQSPATVGPTVSGLSGWNFLNEQNWKTATEYKSGVIAVYYYNNSPVSQQFQQQVLLAPIIAPKLAKLPRLFQLESTPIPAELNLPKNAFTSAPALILLSSTGQVLARLGSSAGVEEVYDKMESLRIR